LEFFPKSEGDRPLASIFGKQGGSIMRDNVLWRKESSIIMMLAEVLHIDAERALNLFYGTETLTGIAINWPGINQK